MLRTTRYMIGGKDGFCHCRYRTLIDSVSSFLHGELNLRGTTVWRRHRLRGREHPGDASRVHGRGQGAAAVQHLQGAAPAQQPEPQAGLSDWYEALTSLH